MVRLHNVQHKCNVGAFSDFSFFFAVAVVAVLGILVCGETEKQIICG